MKTTQFQHAFAYKTQSKSKDSSGVCYFNQDFDNHPGKNLDEYGVEYINNYLHLNDDPFFEDYTKIDATLPDLTEIGILGNHMEPQNPLSQGTDPFLSSFSSTINMLNTMGENETYTDLTSLMPSLNTYSPHSSSQRAGHQQVPSASPSLPPVSESHSFINFSNSHQDYVVPNLSSPSTSSSEITSTNHLSAGRCHSPPSKFMKLEEPMDMEPVVTGTKYVSMRKKNNIASRRSRLTKKEKEKQQEDTALRLEQENDRLRIQISQLEDVTQRLKNKLLNAVRK